MRPPKWVVSEVRGIERRVLIVDDDQFHAGKPCQLSGPACIGKFAVQELGKSVRRALCLGCGNGSDFGNARLLGGCGECQNFVSQTAADPSQAKGATATMI